MRALIVGTAGHVDHGKSSLVLALTGTDPDRLAEEKRRGITIELGFAHLDLGQGRVASFVDVPGHERFVRHMLAGAHGLDAVLLVVAADESVMPQTREHFHICRLLGVRQGLVALTKCDLADADSQALAELEVRELVQGSFLEGAPVLRVSARTGAGLEALRSELERLAGTVGPRGGGGLARLPVDRVFSLRGFGTVVTGTLVAGRLALGDELEALPPGRRCRVRGLQVHGQAVEVVAAGNRVAANLAGVEVGDLARGDVLAPPGTLRAGSLLDVLLQLLPGEKPLREDARLRVHVASAEVLARVRLLGRGELGPGAAAVAQLRLERPAVAGRGDRLVLRSYSPERTLGGARVLDPLPPRRRPADRPRLERAAALADEDAAGAALLMLEEAGEAGLPSELLAARLTLPRPALAALLESRPAARPLGAGTAWIAAGALARLSQRTVAELRQFHARQPLKAAMGREELKSRVFARAAEGALEAVLADLAAGGAAQAAGDGVALAGHDVRLSPEEQAARETLLQAALAGGYRGLESLAGLGRDAGALERVARLLVGSGELQRLGDGLLLHRQRLEELKAEIRRRWPPGARLDVAGFKELTGLSRKYVIPLLECLDRERVTRRSGNDRVVLA